MGHLTFLVFLLGIDKEAAGPNIKSDWPNGRLFPCFSFYKS